MPAVYWSVVVVISVFGTLIGDEVSQHSHRYGGLGLGTTGTSYIFLGCILGLVMYLSVTRRDATERHREVPDAA